ASLELSAPLLIVDPDPTALVSHHFPIRTLTIAQPLVLIHPATEDKTGESRSAPGGGDTISALIESLLHSETELSLSKGQIVIGPPTTSQLHLNDINISQHIDSKKVLIKASAFSPELGNFWCTTTRQLITGEKLTAKFHFQSIPLFALFPLKPDTAETDRPDGSLELNLNITFDNDKLRKILSPPYQSAGSSDELLHLVKGDFSFTHLLGKQAASPTQPPYSLKGELSLNHDGKEFLAQLRGRNISVESTRSFLLPFHRFSHIIQAISDIVKGGEVTSLSLSARGKRLQDLLKPADWLTEGLVQNGSLSIPFPKMDLNGVNGFFSVQGDILRVRNAAATYQKSVGSNCSLDMGFIDHAGLFRLSIDLEASLLHLPDILLQVLHPSEVHNAISELKNLRGKATGRLMVEKKDSHYSTVVDVSRFQVTGRHGSLPYPFSLNGEKLRFTNDSAELGLVNGEMRFSEFTELSGKISWNKDLVYELHIAEGNFGPHLYALLPQRLHLSEQFELNPPFALHDFTLNRRGTREIDIRGTITRQDGEVSLDVRHGPDGLNIRKLAFHDPVSEAQISFNHQLSSQKVDISFDGQLHGSTVANFLSGNTFITGYLKGYTQMLIDLQTPLKSYVSGKLEAKEVNIPLPGKPQPLTISQCLLSGSNNNVELTGTSVQWLNSNINLNGRIIGRPDSVFLKLHADVDRIDLSETIQEIQNILASFEGSGKEVRPDFLGAVQLEAGQLVFGNYSWSKVKSILTIDNKTLTAKIDRAELCGLATLGLVTYSSHDIRLELTPHARPEITDYTIGCLTGKPSTEEMSGFLRVGGTLVTKGKNSDDLIKNIQGSMDLSVTDGSIHNAGTVGTFTNLFSFLRDKEVVQGE
ncbi:MAG: hypothetical protein OEV64_13785, partial [Desulfobulbaceae bacterium]|nr:hypothetical protein [Desulfobulbaceae bacterium]